MARKQAKEPKMPPKSSAPPLVILRDSREQQPWHFRGDHFRANAAQGGGILTVPVTIATLKTGDYSIQGLQDEACIERKSKADLYSSIAYGRQNFEGRLYRMQAMLFSAIVIECEMFDAIMNPPTYIGRDGKEHIVEYSPKSLSRTILSWQIKYPKTHWVWCYDRDVAETWTFRALEMLHRAYFESNRDPTGDIAAARARLADATLDHDPALGATLIPSFPSANGKS